jgi:hypothetical protein
VRRGVAAREKGCRDALDQHDWGEADCVGRQRPPSGASVAVKAPRPNSARMRNSGISRNATKQGIDSNSVSSLAS